MCSGGPKKIIPLEQPPKFALGGVQGLVTLLPQASLCWAFAYELNSHISPSPGGLPLKSDGGQSIKGTKFFQKLYHRVC